MDYHTMDPGKRDKFTALRTSELAYFGTLVTFFCIFTVATSAAERIPDWSCNFSENDCNIIQGHGDDGDWKREKSRIFKWGYYYGARFAKSHKNGDKIVCHLPSVFQSTSGKLAIQYNSNKGRLSITVCNGGPMLRSLEPTGGSRRQNVEIVFSCPTTFEISFTAVKLGGYTILNRYVDIYKIEVYEDPPSSTETTKTRSSGKTTMAITQRVTQSFGRTSLTPTYAANSLTSQSHISTVRETAVNVKPSRQPLQTTLNAESPNKEKQQSGNIATIIPVVVVVILVLIIVTAILLFVHRRRRKARQEKLSEYHGNHADANVYPNATFSAKDPRDNDSQQCSKEPRVAEEQAYDHLNRNTDNTNGNQEQLHDNTYGAAAFLSDRDHYDTLVRPCEAELNQRKRQDIINTKKTATKGAHDVENEYHTLSPVDEKKSKLLDNIDENNVLGETVDNLHRNGISAKTSESDSTTRDDYQILHSGKELCDYNEYQYPDPPMFSGSTASQVKENEGRDQDYFVGRGARGNNGHQRAESPSRYAEEHTYDRFIMKMKREKDSSKKRRHKVSENMKTTITLL